MKRSIVLALLSLSPVIMLLGGYLTAEAAPITTTTTQTTTTFLTLTGSGATTVYQTVTEITTVSTLTETTYTSSRIVAVPVQVMTTVVSPVIKTIYGEGVGCPPSGPCVTTYETMYYTSYVTQVGAVVVYSPALVQTTVTSQYVTSVPTVTSSTTSSTSTYATGQVVSVTNTETLTFVTEQVQVQPPAPSFYDMFSQNLLIAVVLIGLALGGLGYMFGRRRGKPSAVSRPTAVSTAGGFCVSCGTALKPGAKFCGKCGLSTE